MADLFEAASAIGDSINKGLIDARRRATLADLDAVKPDGSLDYGKVAGKMLTLGDLDSALVAGRLAEASSDRAYSRQRDDREFGFRQQEATRAQGNSDRDFGLRSTEQKDLSTDRRDRVAVMRDQARRAGLGQGYEPNPNKPGTARPIEGGSEDPAVIERKAKIQAQNRETPATDKSMIQDADNQVVGARQTITNLRQAMDLSKNIFSGLAATGRAQAASSVPGMQTFFPGYAEAGTNTLKFNNLMKNQVLTNLKATFGGNPSDREGKILDEVIGAENQPLAVQRDILDRAYKAANDRLNTYADRAKRLRAGTYFDAPDGEKSSSTAAPAKSSAPASTAPGLSASDLAEGKYDGKTVQGPDGKRYRVQGGKLAPLP